MRAIMMDLFRNVIGPEMLLKNLGKQVALIAQYLMYRVIGGSNKNADHSIEAM